MELFCQLFLFGFLLFYLAWTIALAVGTLRGFLSGPAKPRAYVEAPRRDWLWASLPQLLRSHGQRISDRGEFASSAKPTVRKALTVATSSPS